MAHHKAGHTTKNVQGNFSLKLPQPFSSQETLRTITCLRKSERLIGFLRKEFSIIKKWSLCIISQMTMINRHCSMWFVSCLFIWKYNSLFKIIQGKVKNYLHTCFYNCYGEWTDNFWLTLIYFFSRVKIIMNVFCF